MNLTFCVLGRQPLIGLAELQSVFGSDKVQKFGDFGAILDVDSQSVPIERLGGTVKVCKCLEEVNLNSWPAIKSHVLSNIDEYFNFSSDQKNRVGISVYGLDVDARQVTSLALDIKKRAKAGGYSIRAVPNTEQTLNSAAVFHNKLAKTGGNELVISFDGKTALISMTTGVQDINSYTIRDRSRPKRDPKVGMLPPKLAQIIINLSQPKPGEIVLDPFCGTGVILQEALLMGLVPYGSDIDQTMIDYSKVNMEWIAEKLPESKPVKLETTDALDHKWQKFDVVASESYLGPPLFMTPSDEKIKDLSLKCSTLVEKFLSNIANQIKPGKIIAIAVPAWLDKNEQFRRLNVVDHLESLGYNLMSFSNVRQSDLIYYRPGQFVGRELLVLKRK